MICFEVFINSERICRAGIGEIGVLSSILTWVGSRQGSENNEVRSRIDFHVGGLAHNGADAHVHWVNKELSIGDEITVRVTESSDSDEPADKYYKNPEEEKKRRREYYEHLKAEFEEKEATD
ncbi:MAG TPA: hypothetical protein VE732_07050 [Nitrososphaera sp.]|jgi:hypothetical protein|nr:hypothetical protein [Nitrososphaera sp.]